jgi:serine/threonine protein kinase
VSRSEPPEEQELSFAVRLERVCDRFEADWRTGQPRIEDYLAGWQGEQRLALLRELVALDLLYRRRRGEECRAANYRGRFPELSADWLAAALAGQLSAPEQRTTAEQERTPPTAEDAEVPPQVGRYRIEGEVGRGGMGVVLRGHDPDFGRALAVKVLLPRHRGNAELERRFLEEARLTGQLQHPGVPAAHEMGTLPDGRPFFALKLVKGTTLAELLTARAGPTEEMPRFLGIFEAVCQTLAYAHSKGVIHRDLKPGNVMVGAFGEVQVMDWGLAKLLGAEPAEPGAGGEEPSTVYTGGPEAALTQAGTVLGTLAYMAPEQARGEVSRVDERADVFGLGAILCVLLTGSPPYAGAQVFRQARQADLAECFARLGRCGAEPELVSLARSCLAPEPADRPRHAGEVAAAVGAYLAGVQERLRRAEVPRERAQAKLLVTCRTLMRRWPFLEDAVMARIAPEQARLAALRVWAAQVRDRQGPHASVSTELAELAGTLAHVLDAAEDAPRTRAATNLAPSLQQTAALLIGRLVLGGVKLSELPASSG